MQIEKIETIAQLSELKQRYVNQATAPLDGMWLTGFVPMANHYGFYDNEKLIGYCCINGEGYLLQFYLSSDNLNQASLIFDSVLTQKSSAIEKVKGAFASTAEPRYLSLCLDSFPEFKVNTLMYQLEKSPETNQEHKSVIELAVVKTEQLNELIEFAAVNTGAPEQWLTGYYTNLINRRELFAYRQNERLLAVGECRGYDEYQIGYADLGMIVALAERGKGLATGVLKQLVILSRTRELIPICSTEATNVGAQKAIGRAGFFATNRIVQFEL